MHFKHYIWLLSLYKKTKAFLGADLMHKWCFLLCCLKYNSYVCTFFLETWHSLYFFSSVLLISKMYISDLTSLTRPSCVLVVWTSSSISPCLMRNPVLPSSRPTWRNLLSLLYVGVLVHICCQSLWFYNQTHTLHTCFIFVWTVRFDKHELSIKPANILNSYLIYID